MTRGVFNWTFYDVRNFLKDRGFFLNHVEGSHYFFLGTYKEKLRQVCVPFHGSRAIDPRTLKSIIRQSGISKEEWLNKN